MKLIAGIADNGTNYKVMSVFQGDEDAIFQFGGVMLYEIPTIECFDTIETALEAGSSVVFPKNLENPLTIADLVIQEIVDEVAAAKVTSKVEIKQFVSNRIGSTSMFDYFAFSTLNNALIDQGYVITDDNREAKYLEIVNTGNSTLIALLDNFLEAKDLLDENKTMMIEYREVVTNIEAATTTTEIQGFLDTYYAAYA